MGLFKFLKEKFGKKHEKEEIKVEEPEVLETKEEPKEEAAKEPEPIKEPEQMVEEIKPEPVEEPKIEEPVVEEIKPESVAEQKIEEPVVEEIKPEQVVEVKPIEQPKVEEIKPEQVVEVKPIEQPKVEKIIVETTNVEQPQPKVESKKEEKPTKVEKKAESKEEKQTKKYIKGMEKSREAFANKIEKLSKKYRKVNQEYFEQLEEILIEADVGVNLTLSVIDDVISESKAKKIDNAEEITELVIDRLFEGYMNSGAQVSSDINFRNDGPTVLLVAGVNGVGKTTTIAKLANRYINQGKKVMLCAADTFRAGAIEQLSIWAERLGCPIVVGKPESDPASVAFEGAKRAKQEGIDLLIVDTAGRLQNKINLMNELSKISRVISKEIPDSPHEVFLIIDATTGQNGVVQAKQFKECINITGIVITKMDGTSKGGIILAIRDELGIPVRFIGLGETMDDLQEFDLEKYLVGLLIGDPNE